MKSSGSGRKRSTQKTIEIRGVFNKQHPRMCYTRIYYSDTDVQETSASVALATTCRNRLCPLYLVTMGVCWSNECAGNI